MKISRYLLLALCVVLGGGLALADAKVTTEHHSDPVQMGGREQPAQDFTSTTWFGEDRMRHDQEDSSFLLRLDQDKIYVINHGNKTYSVLDLPIDFASLLPPEMKAMADQMMKMMTIEASVQTTEETKEVNGWTAKKSIVDLSMPMGASGQVTVWATTNVPVDLDLYDRMIRAQGEMFPQLGFMKEIAKIEGFPVLQETRMSGMGTTMTSRQEVTAIEEMDAPAGTYEVPQGYTEEEFNPLAGMQPPQGGR
jgi:hypothetical protein